MKKKLKIITVCGFGIGTSLVLKMKIDEVIKKHGIYAEVLPCDITSVFSEICDVCFTSAEMAYQIVGKTKFPVVVIKNFINLEEIEEKCLNTLEELGRNSSSY